MAYTSNKGYAILHQHIAMLPVNKGPVCSRPAATPGLLIVGQCSVL